MSGELNGPIPAFTEHRHRQAFAAFSREVDAKLDERPFRHLCPVADERDAMTDGEYWDDVAESILGNHMAQVFDDEDGPWDPTTDLPVEPCEVCGTAETACGYDESGLPYVHCTPPTDTTSKEN